MHGFVGGVPCIEVRENKDSGVAGKFAVRSLGVGYFSIASGIVLERAINEKLRLKFMNACCGGAHFVDITTRTGIVRGVRDHGYAWVDTKSFGRVRALDGNVCEKIGVGVEVDGAVTID